MKRSLAGEIVGGNQNHFEKHFFTRFYFTINLNLRNIRRRYQRAVSRPTTHTFTGSAFARVVIFSVCFPMSRRWVTGKTLVLGNLLNFRGPGPAKQRIATAVMLCSAATKGASIVFSPLSFKRGLHAESIHVGAAPIPKAMKWRLV